MSKTIFLSTVSREFSGLRRRLATVCTRTKRLHVRHQDDFIQRGVLTLQMLEEEIRKSDLVVHLIGAEFGSVPPVNQVDDLLRRLPEFESRFPDVAARARQREISYTQWEAWLALYFQSQPGSTMRLCRYEVADSRAHREPLQAAHLERMRQEEFFPQKVAPGGDPFDEVLLSLIELGYLTEAESRRIIHLPYPSIGTLFKGREAFLDQLRQSLQRDVGGTATAITGKAVHGLGGVGKTRLAVEYAWQHADQYSAVLLVTADSPASLRQNLAALTGPLVLNLPEQSATEEEIRVAAALRWLHGHPGWFLILDNVDTEPAAEYVEELLARLHSGQVLITSRLGKWSSSIEPLELDVLETAAAAHFLLERTQPQSGGRGRLVQPADDAAAAELARKLDGLALALEQAGAYICQKRISLAEYLNRWRSHVADVQIWHDRTMNYPKSVAVTWQTTLDQLAPDQVVLLNVLAWLAPEPIPLAVLSHLSVESLASLRPFCLHSSTAGNSQSPEPTAAEALRKNKSSDRRLSLRERAPFRGAKGDNSFRAVPSEAPQDGFGLPGLDPLGSPGGEPAQLTSEIPVSLVAPLRDLLANLADFSMIRWDTQADSITVHRVVQGILRTRQTQPVPVLTAALKMLRAALPKRSPDDVRTWAQWDLLRPHVAFAVAEADLCDITEPTTLLMGELGSLLHSKALHADAELLMRRALAIDEKVFGPDSTEVSLRLNNLAYTLKDANYLAEAEPLMRRALAIDVQSFGPEHPTVARDLNNLAQLLQATNRLAEAEPLMHRALAIDEQGYGDVHPNVAIRLNNLALLLQATNRLAEAEPLVCRALAIDEDYYGTDHPNVATRLNNLAALLHATNRLVEAEPLMRRALAIDVRSYGADHPNVARDLSNLAQLLQETNRLAEAEPLICLALAIDEKSYGAVHPKVAIRLNNLAQLLRATDRLAEADPLMARVVSIFEKSVGEKHPNVATALNNLASLLQATNRLADAEPLMRRHVAIFALFGRQTGHEHPHMQAATENYRQLLAAMNIPDDEIDRRLAEATQ